MLKLLETDALLGAIVLVSSRVAAWWGRFAHGADLKKLQAQFGEMGYLDNTATLMASSAPRFAMQ